MIEEFKEKYEHFCEKYGFKVCNIEEHGELLEGFGVFLKQKNDKSTDLFTNIVWKSKQLSYMVESTKISTSPVLECRLGSDASNKNFSNSETDLFEDNTNSGSLSKFLFENCRSTQFQSDTIFLSEFKERYDQWCEIQGITNMNKDPLETEEDYTQIKLFGAQFEGAAVVQKLVGIMRFPIFLADYNIIAKDSGIMKFQSGFCLKDRKKETKIFDRLCGLRRGHLLYDSLITWCQFIAILFIPAPAILICLAVEEVSSSTFLSVSVPINVVTLLSDPILLFTELSVSSRIIISICIIYFAVGIVQMVVYNLTLLAFQPGRATIATFSRRCIDTMFDWTTTIMFFFILNYFILVLIWCVLGAVLNPTRFLPYAAAATTFIATLSSKMRQLKHLQYNIKEKVDDIVDAKIQELLQNTMLQRLKFDKQVFCFLFYFIC